MHKYKIIRSTLALLLTTLLISSCSFFTPSKPTVQQGNIINEATANQLKVGMTKEAVTELVGSPVLMSLFNQDEWHYVYSLQREKHPFEKRSITLIFRDDRIVRILRATH